MSTHGVLEVGTNGSGEVVINHPDLQPDDNGVGHIVFSVEQARNLANLLQSKAADALVERGDLKTTFTNHSRRLWSEDECRIMLNASLAKLIDDVLTADERGKGFVRPYRDAYRHLKCGKITTMSRSIAETYARDPFFYSGTFCTTCGFHFPIGEDGEFTWYEMDGTTGPKVGT